MILLMGVAGAGKSMQSRLLADEYGYAWISTGEILRVLVTGQRRREMLAGKLLEDHEMIQIMDKVLELIDPHQEIILDGFPRTIPQADWILQQVRDSRFELTGIFHMTASKNVVHHRLVNRGRQDDTDDAIKQRFDEYETVTLPIIDHFQREGITVFEIDASKDPRQVHDAIMKVVKRIEPEITDV
jgi:adenylate kinase